MATAPNAAPAQGGDDGPGALITHAPYPGAEGTSQPASSAGFDLSIFSGPADEDGDGGDAGADDGLGAEGDEGDEGQNASPAAAAPGASPAQGLTGEQLQALLQGNSQLAESVRQLVATHVSRTPAAPAQGSDAPKIYVTPEAIPAPMQALMNSEDPAERNRGFAAFGNALVTAVLRQVEQDVNERYLPDFTSRYESHYDQRAKSQQWEQTFNTEYPNLLNDDKGRLVVQVAVSQAANVLKQQGVPEAQIVWGNPKYREAFNTILQSVGYVGGVVKAKTAPANPNNPAPRPGARVGRGGGARPADPGGGNSQADQIAAVLATVANGRR